MDEKELQEFSLEDIMNEFHDAPNEEELKALAEEGISFDAAEETAQQPPVSEEPEAPAAVESVEESPVEEIPEEESQTVTGDTIRIDTAQFGKGEVHNAQPVAEEPAAAPETAEPFSDNWEPEYEDPIAEYVPPRPILFHPRSKLKELKSKLVAGPEKVYYKLMEKGLGKLQTAIFFSVLTVLVSVVLTAMHALDFVQDDRIRFMVFAQLLVMLICALLGSNQLISGFLDLFRKRFTLNSLLVFTFVLCCVDGILCLRELRIPCCAAFGLQVTMSLWSAYQKRNTLMGQMDTMRKATRLNGVAAVTDYYEGTTGLLRTEAEVEDFMDAYDTPSKLDRIQSVYALIALCVSVVAGIVMGVLHGVSMGIQVAAVSTLASMPATMFIAMSRPAAVLEKRLHGLGAVICGWPGVEALSEKAVFPVNHEDLCPTGTVKLNGVKFYGDREADEVIAYCAALVNVSGGALKPLFDHLLDSRNGIHYEVANYNAYPTGGVGGEINGEPVLVGTLPFLKSMGVEVPESLKVNHAVGVSVDGELTGLFAITYDKVRSAAAGITTLCSYSRLKPILTSTDFMLTDEFIRNKFGVNPKKIVFPDHEARLALQEKQLSQEDPVHAISTADGLASYAYCVTGAKALKTACTLGVLMHIIGGALGIAMMVVLGALGARELMNPVNMFLYELVWLVPGLLITEWTRSL